MKAAVVFYSLDGNCTFVARQIGSLLKADIVQIKTQDEKKRSGFIKIMWGVTQVMFNKKPALKPYEFDAAVYDLIVLGTPVWAGSPSPAIKCFLSQMPISGKKIALFACHAGGQGKVMQKLKAVLKDNTIVSEKDIFKAVENAEETQRQIEDWVKSFNNS
jgi:flavodoxin